MPGDPQAQAMSFAHQGSYGQQAETDFHHLPRDGVVVMRDREAVVPAEAKARAKNIPVAVIEARVW